jgi:hypothetical protein
MSDDDETRPASKGRMFEDPELLTEIAIRAFARATDAAIRENDRLGIPSYGGKDGKIVVRHPPVDGRGGSVPLAPRPHIV